MPIQFLNFVVGVNHREIHKYVLDKYVSPCFGAVAGTPRYDARADFDKNGKIDLVDIQAFTDSAELTFKTFGITPLLWWHVAVPVGLGLVGVGALILLRR